MKDPRRWLVLVALTAALAWVAATYRPKAKAGPNQPCLVQTDCASSLRCYVEPKADGFATWGNCVEPCLDDLQCAAGSRCAMTGLGQEQLVPVMPGLQPGQRVCVRGSAGRR